MAAARARRADALIVPLSQQSQRDRGFPRPHQGQESRYQKLSERLDEILERLGEHWEQLVLELQGFVTELAEPPPDDGTGLDATEIPFHNVLADALPDADPARVAELLMVTRDIVAKARSDVRTVGFWSNGYRQDELRKWIKLHLDQTDLWSLPACDQLAAQLLELARANNHRLVAS